VKNFLSKKLTSILINMLKSCKVPRINRLRKNKTLTIVRRFAGDGCEKILTPDCSFIHRIDFGTEK
jgi:hypothetical protein